MFNYFLILFALIGLIDYILNNKYGYGKEFFEGISSIPSLILSMLGILTLIPAIKYILQPCVKLLSLITLADQSLFINSLLASDMGGFALGKLISTDITGIYFSGILVGSMLGSTLSFTIPIAFGLLSSEDKPLFSKGILIGIFTIPIGCFIGGLVAKFPLKFLLINIIPIILLSVILGTLLKFYPKQTIKLFIKLELFLKYLSVIGICIFIIEFLGDISILNSNIDNLNNIKIILKIAFTLAGALPFLFFIKNNFNKSLNFISIYLNINNHSVTGLLASLANNILAFKLLKNMDYNGKIINSAFSVSGAFVFGGQLAFTLAVAPEMLFPFIIGKLSAGLSAIFFAKRIILKEKHYELKKNKCY